MELVKTGIKDGIEIGSDAAVEALAVLSIV